VACPEWRGLKGDWLDRATDLRHHCSGLPRMGGTESIYRGRSRSVGRRVGVACPGWRGVKGLQRVYRCGGTARRRHVTARGGEEKLTLSQPMTVPASLQWLAPKGGD